MERRVQRVHRGKLSKISYRIVIAVIFLIAFNVIASIAKNITTKDYVIEQDVTDRQIESISAPPVEEEKKETTSKGFVIENRDGVTYIDNVLIVNKTYGLPKDYNDGGDLTKDTQAAFEKMQSDAAEEGLDIYIASGYRSYDDQATVYNGYVEEYGRAVADRDTARPGYSEHQLGMAIDVNETDNEFAETDEGIWLAENCYKYGFIIRYPEGKEKITGYDYESWHIRYLGTDLATKITKSGLTVEEYYGITSAYQ